MSPPLPSCARTYASRRATLRRPSATRRWVCCVVWGCGGVGVCVWLSCALCGCGRGLWQAAQAGTTRPYAASQRPQPPTHPPHHHNTHTTTPYTTTSTIQHHASQCTSLRLLDPCSARPPTLVALAASAARPRAASCPLGPLSTWSSCRRTLSTRRCALDSQAARSACVSREVALRPVCARETACSRGVRARLVAAGPACRAPGLGGGTCGRPACAAQSCPAHQPVLSLHPHPSPHTYTHIRTHFLSLSHTHTRASPAGRPRQAARGAAGAAGQRGGGGAPPAAREGAVGGGRGAGAARAAPRVCAGTCGWVAVLLLMWWWWWLWVGVAAATKGVGSSTGEGSNAAPHAPGATAAQLAHRPARLAAPCPCSTACCPACSTPPSTRSTAPASSSEGQQP